MASGRAAGRGRGAALRILQRTPGARPGLGGGRRLLAVELGLPFTARRERVHLRAVDERLLRRRDVVGLARPCALRRVLERAAVREGEPPRRTADAVDRIEVRRRLLIALAPGEERDPRYGARHAPLEDAHGRGG